MFPEFENSCTFYTDWLRLPFTTKTKIPIPYSAQLNYYQPETAMMKMCGRKFSISFVCVCVRANARVLVLKDISLIFSILYSNSCAAITTNTANSSRQSVSRLFVRTFLENCFMCVCVYCIPGWLEVWKLSQMCIENQSQIVCGRYTYANKRPSIRSQSSFTKCDSIEWVCTCMWCWYPITSQSVFIHADFPKHTLQQLPYHKSGIHFYFRNWFPFSN